MQFWNAKEQKMKHIAEKSIGAGEHLMLPAHNIFTMP